MSVLVIAEILSRQEFPRPSWPLCNLPASICASLSHQPGRARLTYSTAGKFLGGIIHGGGRSVCSQLIRRSTQKRSAMPAADMQWRARKIALQASRLADQARPMTKKATITARRGAGITTSWAKPRVGRVRAWMAVRAARGSISVQEHVAPRVSSVLATAARKPRPAAAAGPALAEGPGRDRVAGRRGGRGRRDGHAQQVQGDAGQRIQAPASPRVPRTTGHGWSTRARTSSAHHVRARRQRPVPHPLNQPEPALTASSEEGSAQSRKCVRRPKGADRRQNRAVLLCELVATSAQVAASPGRKAKITAIAELLARVPPDEVPIAVAFLSGDLTQRQIGVGYAALMDLRRRPARAGRKGWAKRQGQGSRSRTPVLTLRETDDTFEAIGAMLGPGSQAQRRAALAGLIGRATETERQFLFRLIAGELRQGALEGVMTEAVALAAGVPAPEVRRANQLRGSLPQVAQGGAGAAARATGRGPARTAWSRCCSAFTLQVGQPIKPMLAASAPTVEAALAKISPAALDWKIDGIRIQIHRQGQRVRIFTRTLDDITERVPEIVEIALALDVESAVIDGEAIALRPDGRPYPFQVTSARAASQLVGRPAGRRRRR